MIKVVVAGSEGRMGQEVCAAVEEAAGMELTGRADPALGTAVGDFLADADVLVDFTRPETAVANIRAATAAGVHAVVGTTGFEMAELEGISGSNVLVAPKDSDPITFPISGSSSACNPMLSCPDR